MDQFPHNNGPYGKGGILFFDGFTESNTRLQDYVIRLAQTRKINTSEGTYELPDKWIIIAAGHGNLNPALADRFTIVNYVPES
jgi:MoxR-like ATPase